MQPYDDLASAQAALATATRRGPDDEVERHLRRVSTLVMSTTCAHAAASAWLEVALALARLHRPVTAIAEDAWVRCEHTRHPRRLEARALATLVGSATYGPLLTAAEPRSGWLEATLHRAAQLAHASPDAWAQAAQSAVEQLRSVPASSRAAAGRWIAVAEGRSGWEPHSARSGPVLGFDTDRALIRTVDGACALGASQRRFDLALALALQPAQPAPLLFERVWGQRFRGRCSTNALHASISRLRAALDSAGIRTPLTCADGRYAFGGHPTVYVRGQVRLADVPVLSDHEEQVLAAVRAHRWVGMWGGTADLRVATLQRVARAFGGRTVWVRARGLRRRGALLDAVAKLLRTDPDQVGDALTRLHHPLLVLDEVGELPESDLGDLIFAWTRRGGLRVATTSPRPRGSACVRMRQPPPRRRSPSTDPPHERLLADLPARLRVARPVGDWVRDTEGTVVARLDPCRGVAEVEGARLELRARPTQLALLWALSGARRPLSTADLQRCIWGEVRGDAGALHAAIRRLRSRLPPGHTIVAGPTGHRLEPSWERWVPRHAPTPGPLAPAGLLCDVQALWATLLARGWASWTGPHGHTMTEHLLARCRGLAVGVAVAPGEGLTQAMARRLGVAHEELRAAMEPVSLLVATGDVPHQTAPPWNTPTVWVPAGTLAPAPAYSRSPWKQIVGCLDPRRRRRLQRELGTLRQPLAPLDLHRADQELVRALRDDDLPGEARLRGLQALWEIRARAGATAHGEERLAPPLQRLRALLNRHGEPGDWGRALIAQGTSALWCGDLATAREHYEIAARLAQTWQLPVLNGTARLGEAWTALREERLEDCHAALDAAAPSRPADVHRCWALRLAVALDRADPSAMHALLRRAPASSDGRITLRRAMAHHALGHTAESRALYAEAIRWIAEQDRRWLAAALCLAASTHPSPAPLLRRARRALIGGDRASAALIGLAEARLNDADPTSVGGTIRAAGHTDPASFPSELVRFAWRDWRPAGSAARCARAMA